MRWTKTGKLARLSPEALLSKVNFILYDQKGGESVIMAVVESSTYLNTLGESLSLTPVLGSQSSIFLITIGTMSTLCAVTV